MRFLRSSIHRRVALSSIAGLALSCAPIATDDSPCHDGGAGECVAFDACSEGFALDGQARCSRWRETAPPPFATDRATAVLLADGRVLVDSSPTAIFDPSTEEWQVIEGAFGSEDASMALLRSGDVLRADVDSVDLFQPALGEWQRIASLDDSFIFEGLPGPTVFVDADGVAHVLFAALIFVDLSLGGGSLRFDEAARTATFEDERPRIPRQFPRVHSLSDGRAVLLGGFFNGSVQASIEVFNIGAWRTVQNSFMRRMAFASGILGDEETFVVAGGRDDETDFFASTLLIDSTSFRVEEGPSLPRPCRLPGGATLADGSFIVVGGEDFVDFFDDANLILPDATLVRLPPLPTATSNASAFELRDGRAFVVTGQTLDNVPHAYILERGT